jgi:hypothetical protein
VSSRMTKVGKGFTGTTEDSGVVESR